MKEPKYLEALTAGNVLVAENSVNMGEKNILDLSSLAPDQKKQIAQKAQEAKIALKVKAEEAAIDVQVLDTTLTNLNTAARDATRDGTSITVTHTETSSTGRTEVVVGNTEKAAAGKISRSAKGFDDNSTKLAFVIAAGAVLVALIIALGV